MFPPDRILERWKQHTVFRAGFACPRRNIMLMASCRGICEMALSLSMLGADVVRSWYCIQYTAIKGARATCMQMCNYIVDSA